MTAYNIAVGGTTHAIAAHYSGRAFVIPIEIDFAKTPYLAGDVLTVANIPAGTFVEHVAYEVVTAEGATCTADIGDGDSATGYYSNVNLNSAAKGCNILTLAEGAPNTISSNTGGKFYSAAGLIKVNLDHDTDAAKLRIWVACWEFAIPS